MIRSAKIYDQISNPTFAGDRDSFCALDAQILYRAAFVLRCSGGPDPPADQISGTQIHFQQITIGALRCHLHLSFTAGRGLARRPSNLDLRFGF